jgi:uncharacterized protein (DUF2267 family)
LQENIMSNAGLEVFDKTLQTTHIWLDELMRELIPDRQLAWHVLGAVLRALRDRLPLGVAVHLGSQLPLLVRGTYYEQWHAPGQTLDNPPRSLDEFLGPISKQLSGSRPVNVRKATGVVFQILSQHVDKGQIEKVRDCLPEQVRNIWHNGGDVVVTRKPSADRKLGTESPDKSSINASSDSESLKRAVDDLNSRG